MATGADFSGAILRTLQWEDRRVLCRSIAAAYCDIDPTGPNRALIDRARIPHAACDDGLLLYGNDAVRYHQTFGRPLCPLLQGGSVSQTDVVPRQLLAVATESILPPPRHEGEICAFCSTSALSLGDVPAELAAEAAAPLSGDANDRFFAKIIELSGYTPVRLSVPQATLLAAGAAHGFNGVVVTARPDRLELSVCQLARELLHIAVTPPRRTDAAAEGNAVGTGADAAEATDASQSAPHRSDHSLLEPTTVREAFGVDEAALLDGLDGLIAAAADRIRTGGLARSVRGTLPLIVHGLSTPHDVLQDRLEALLREFEWPLACETLLFADDPHTVVRGALIAATLEETTRGQQTAAA
ncbi:MAG: hypothetical protein D6725_14510 [Planctomycetota bacterium]|nr:MAG: hypothetical protein D6725_14510 [Planctomycetota bacterium]